MLNGECLVDNWGVGKGFAYVDFSFGDMSLCNSGVFQQRVGGAADN